MKNVIRLIFGTLGIIPLMLFAWLAILEFVCLFPYLSIDTVACFILGLYILTDTPN